MLPLSPPTASRMVVGDQIFRKILLYYETNLINSFNVCLITASAVVCMLIPDRKTHAVFHLCLQTGPSWNELIGLNKDCLLFSTLNTIFSLVYFPEHYIGFYI